MKYSTLVYPQAEEGQPYSRPVAPETFIRLFENSPTWNPYSANPLDRTEYWEDSDGVLELHEVDLTLYGLEGVRQKQINMLALEYFNVVESNVEYTSDGGVTAVYQADTDSMKAVLYTIAGCAKNGQTPLGFGWQDSSNNQHPFTYNDLFGLADAMFTKGGPAFFHLQVRKAQVRAATTVLAVQAIVW